MRIAFKIPFTCNKPNFRFIHFSNKEMLKVDVTHLDLGAARFSTTL